MHRPRAAVSVNEELVRVGSLEVQHGSTDDGFFCIDPRGHRQLVHFFLDLILDYLPHLDRRHLPPNRQVLLRYLLQILASALRIRDSMSSWK